MQGQNWRHRHPPADLGVDLTLFDDVWFDTPRTTQRFSRGSCTHRLCHQSFLHPKKSQHANANWFNLIPSDLIWFMLLIAYILRIQIIAQLYGSQVIPVKLEPGNPHPPPKRRHSGRPRPSSRPRHLSIFEGSGCDFIDFSRIWMYHNVSSLGICPYISNISPRWPHFSWLNSHPGLQRPAKAADAREELHEAEGPVGSISGLDL